MRVLYSLRDALLKLFTFVLLSVLSCHVVASSPIKGFGQFYQVPAAQPLNKDSHFKIVFDIAKQAKEGQLSSGINSLARFINMHVDNGVPLENIQLALVVHGGASKDMLTDKYYQARFGKSNGNQDLVNQLLAHNTEIYICGQSATHYDVTTDELIPGVKMMLSAMTAHSYLQQQGYSLNPF